MVVSMAQNLCKIKGRHDSLLQELTGLFRCDA